ANEVGGDFYDVFALDDDERWALVIGDVCGSGPAAAALTGLARHTIRASAWRGDTPIEILTNLNNAVQRSDSDSFLTAAYGVMTANNDGAHLTLAHAGHPLAVLVRDDVATNVGIPGTLLGVLDSVNFTPVTVALQRGDVLVFYTDGATDVPKHSIDERQWRELVAAAARSQTTADGVADAIRDSLEEVLSFDRRDDDIALVIVRVIGGPRATNEFGQ
ncbi:MAG TPA: PP2C family protein-serine/threonine phosphatase, partial [Ilumatobacteraceae bacterium]|nr:PP2C family protein-serine/threonine phosphatase [Ilumatobacteraceae bacterium]